MADSNTGDRRSVSTDALETLGTIIDINQKRDAIHLAVDPVIAGERLAPGSHISVKEGIAFYAPVGKGLGIVDPFLLKPVELGERFWFVMYPRQVRSLRHVWTHPAFPDEPMPLTLAERDAAEAELVGAARSEKWLRDYAEEINVGYRDLINCATEWVATGDYMMRGGTLEGVSTSSEFWEHFEKVTGIIVPSDKRRNFFSCSC